MVQRGFKTWCEKIASQYRKQLQIGEREPLCARKLSEHLGVLVWSPANIPDLPRDISDQLLVKDSLSWSAVTISHLGKDVIILNSSHASGRQSNDLMHELSHIICGHKPARVDVSEQGWLILQSYDKDREEEADLLAATLLLPRVALLRIKRMGKPLSDVTKEFNVSEHLLRWRLDTTGVNRQFQHRRKYI